MIPKHSAHTNKGQKSPAQQARTETSQQQQPRPSKWMARALMQDRQPQGIGSATFLQAGT